MRLVLTAARPLVEEQKKLEEARPVVSDHELTTDISHACLDTREVELVDKERRLAET
jgi:hypothetical protein